MAEYLGNVKPSGVKAQARWAVAVEVEDARYLILKRSRICRLALG